MTKHIIFDLGQVLIKVVFPEFVEKFADEFCVDPDLLRKNKNNGAHIEFMTGNISPEEFHEQTCEYFNHFISIDRFKDLWLQMLGEQISDTGLIVNELFDKKFNLALLSNVDPWHFEYCKVNIPALEKMSNKFTSYELKLKKPDLEIYNKVADELKTTPENCLLIDDMAENIDAAKQAGYDGIRFLDANQLREELEQRRIL